MSDNRPLADIPFAAEPKGRLLEIRLALTELTPPTLDKTGNVVKDPDKDKREALETEAEPLEQQRLLLAETVRRVFADIGCKTGQDIIELGCTGLVAKGIPVEEVSRLRSDLGGTGIGCPCYVTPHYFCVACNTIGGVQEGQEPRFVEVYDQMTRPLTPEEKGHMALTEEARNIEGDDRRGAAMKALRGREMPEGVELDSDNPGIEFENAEDVSSVTSADFDKAMDDLSEKRVSTITLPMPRLTADAMAELGALLNHLVLAVRFAHATEGDEAAIDAALGAIQQCKGLNVDIFNALTFLADAAAKRTFECSEHPSASDRGRRETNWECRYCVAAAVAAGELDLQYLLTPTVDDNHAMMEDSELVKAADVNDRIKHFDGKDVPAVGLFLKVTAFRRRLTQD